MLTDLSVLVCSLASRTDTRARLMDCLAAQDPALLARTQILVDVDAGQVTIGAKRQRLLKASVGRYVAFIDDDDMVTDDYLTELFRGIEKGVDHIGVRMLLISRGQKRDVECSMHHTAWAQKDGVYLRGAQHVCAVKRGLALAAGFPDVSFGEDRAYCDALTPLVTSEYLTSGPVYIYLWEPR